MKCQKNRFDLKGGNSLINKNYICEYCTEHKHYKGAINGKVFYTQDLKETYGYSSRMGSRERDYLNIYILKGENDKYAGLMVENINGARYVDIRYCPFCGRKLSDN